MSEPKEANPGNTGEIISLELHGTLPEELTVSQRDGSLSIPAKTTLTTKPQTG